MLMASRMARSPGCEYLCKCAVDPTLPSTLPLCVSTLQYLVQIIDRVQVGPLPVHLYAIVETLEVWSHSDMTGTFDTISITAPNALNTTVAVRCVSD